MPDVLSVNVDGLEEVIAKLESVKNSVRLENGRDSLKKAAFLIRDAARASAKRIDNPETTNDIYKNIVASFQGKTFKRTGDLMYRVGILGGSPRYIKVKEREKAYKRSLAKETAGKKSRSSKREENPGGDTFYWRFVEFGTKNSRPKPFFENILRLNAQRATDEFIKQYGKALDRAIRKANK